MTSASTPSRSCSSTRNSGVPLPTGSENFEIWNGISSNGTPTLRVSPIVFGSLPSQLTASDPSGITTRTGARSLHFAGTRCVHTSGVQVKVRVCGNHPVISCHRSTPYRGLARCCWFSLANRQGTLVKCMQALEERQSRSLRVGEPLAVRPQRGQPSLRTEVDEASRSRLPFKGRWVSKFSLFTLKRKGTMPVAGGPIGASIRPRTNVRHLGLSR